MSEPIAVLITCEHGGNEVPPEYAHLFASPETQDLLRSHRGWDPGALLVATDLAQHVPAPLISCVVTRLLIETNRSLHAHDLFSPITRDLPQSERDALIERYYAPHRARLERCISVAVDSGQRVLHLSVHSCTDNLNGQSRDFELGLLFDPERSFEATVVEHITGCIARERPRYRVVHNQPYLGTDDGLTTEMRKQFPGSKYAGIEFELRQGHIINLGERQSMAHALTLAIQSFLKEP